MAKPTVWNHSLAPAPQTHVVDKYEIELDQQFVQHSYDEDEGDFGPPHQYYKSEKILGKLYRAIDERKIWFEDVRSSVVSDADAFWRQFIRSCTQRCNSLGYIVWKPHCGQARRIRLAYVTSSYS